MFDRVVEGDCLAFDPAASLAADPELAPAGDDQGQVNDAARIGHPCVRRDVAAGLQDREEDVRRAALDPADRQRYDEGGGARRSSAGLVEALALFPQMKGAP